MSRYPEVERFDPVAVEEAVLARWEAEDTFAQSLAIREGAPHFVFYEGPPTANGMPGIHHVMARTIKDLFCRYKTMRGFRVDRKAGWDTHGLPVEIEVEKELGLEGRHQVEEYGIAKYNAACRESVLRYKDLWDRLTVRMGYWVDLDDPYVTFENDYIESVWHLLKRIWDKGLLSQGHKIQWYSPANGTVLSSHEVSLGYKEVQDVSIVTRARLVADPQTSLLAWTTTPWTVPSNAAMAVGLTIPYVKARQMVAQADGSEAAEYLIVAKNQVGAILKGDYEVVEEMTGAELVGLRYEPMWPTFAERGGADADAWQVVAADYVTTDDGTGIVHTAPAFGADDFATGQKHDLPVFNPVEADGRFEADFPVIGGMTFKEADRPIIRDLAERGLLYREDSYVHNYPHDWRKGTPLMQYPVESWFVRTTAIKDRLVALNQEVNWQPEGIGTGRFGGWLENNVDWALSRSRYWGTPLPIWVSDRDPEVMECIGSIDELREKVGGTFPEAAINPGLGTVDLHRPYVDALTWPDGQGGTMRRVPDLIDVWFDSGAMPFAQWHYPFENEERFAANAPADFIAEGVDQTRGWFYTLHAIAALVDDRVAYKNVVVNGLVLDAEGEKMSKSKGNAIEPFEAIERHGVDPIRWTMMSAAAPWENLRYADSDVVETTRKVFGTVVNTYRFFATYATLDGYAYDAATALPASGRTELDRWVLSRLQSTVAEAVGALDAYHPTRAARAIEAFVDDLSNWYLRRSRRRFWSQKVGRSAGRKVEGEPSDVSTFEPSDRNKQAAYDTLFECLEAVARLMAPIAPFTAEWLYGVLGHPASVHLQLYPEADATRLDVELEGRMALARAVTTATLALRNEAGVNVRQPLRSVLVVTGVGGVDEAVLRSVEDVVLDEVNVKTLETASGDSGVV
ncbi:MAG: isoleucine--tRNA ligase, partial [Bacteroidota bacterium]